MAAALTAARADLAAVGGNIGPAHPFASLVGHPGLAEGGRPETVKVVEDLYVAMSEQIVYYVARPVTKVRVLSRFVGAPASSDARVRDPPSSAAGLLFAGGQLRQVNPVSNVLLHAARMILYDTLFNYLETICYASHTAYHIPRDALVEVLHTVYI